MEPMEGLSVSPTLWMSAGEELPRNREVRNRGEYYFGSNHHQWRANGIGRNEIN